MDNTKATFEGIRENIVEYLSANPLFKDYNFTAPAISTLIDALAYTSHYLVRYANFSLNECFLDSAQLRNNVVSHAKEVGYIPHQWKAARAKLRLTVTDKTISMAGKKIDKDTLFTATNYETMKSYTFRTIDQYSFVTDEKGVWYADIDVYEGTFVTEKFLQDEYYTTRYFLINENVDTDFMTVTVHKSQSDPYGEQYERATDISSFVEDNNLYYIYEAYNGKIEICFGDGKLSRKIDPYSNIKVKYLVTNGSEANNIKNFVLSQNIVDVSSDMFSLDVLVPSESGGERESIESIRFNAPKFYQAQDRAVTTSDYNTLLLNKFGSIIDSVVTWGGEEDSPPQYGSVFICVRPRNTEALSPSQKSDVIKYLESKNLPCVDVQIVDPSYIDVDMDIFIDWNKYKTSRSKSELSNIIEDTTRSVFKINTTSFKSKFKYSKYLTEINSLDDSIESILTNFKLRQYLVPESLQMRTSHIFEFHNELEPGSVFIGEWKERGDNFNTYSISDKDEDGILWLKVTDGTIEKFTKIGNVNYKTGRIFVDNYFFNNVKFLTQIPVECVPKLDNLVVMKKHLLRLSKLTVNISES